MTTEPTKTLTELERRVRADLATMAYPDRDWVEPLRHASGVHVHDVVIVGGGQSGLAIAFQLRRDGVRNIAIIDRRPAGVEGVWEDFGRMETLRTPKFLVGVEGGVASLSVRAWYEAQHGSAAWAALDRVGRRDWMRYLRWLRRMMALDVQNDTALEAIDPDGDVFALRVRGPRGPETLLARHVVLATGYDGGGEWRVPQHIVAAVPPERRRHSNGPVDFAAMRGVRVGVLGHAASAFDNAVRALESGAASVDLCFRRPSIPQVNPHRWIEFGGFLKHFPDLDDRTRWNVNRHFKRVDQPPAKGSYFKAQSFEQFRMHAATPWDHIAFEDGEIRVRVGERVLRFDQIICATGSAIDLPHRPELRGFAGEIARWRDRFTPSPSEDHPTLGDFPYLDRHYGFQERVAGNAPWLSRIRAFNFSAIVSMGPHSTSISGHKYSVPRLVTGVTRDLFLQQQDWLTPALEAYDETDLAPPVAAPQDAA